MKTIRTLFLTFALAISMSLHSQPKPPLMGWASWNNYHVSINEDIIKAQAGAMASNGMKEAGYQ